MSFDSRSAHRPPPDPVLVDIAEYALSYRIDSDLAYETAFYCLMDTLACGLQALKYPACTKLLGPIVPGATMPGGQTFVVSEAAANGDPLGNVVTAGDEVTSFAITAGNGGGATVLRGCDDRDLFVLEVCGALELFRIDADHRCEPATPPSGFATVEPRH